MVRTQQVLFRMVGKELSHVETVVAAVVQAQMDMIMVVAVRLLLGRLEQSHPLSVIILAGLVAEDDLRKTDGGDHEAMALSFALVYLNTSGLFFILGSSLMDCSIFVDPA